MDKLKRTSISTQYRGAFGLLILGYLATFQPNPKLSPNPNPRLTLQLTNSEVHLDHLDIESISMRLCSNPQKSKVICALLTWPCYLATFMRPSAPRYWVDIDAPLVLPLKSKVLLCFTHVTLLPSNFHAPKRTSISSRYRCAFGHGQTPKNRECFTHVILLPSNIHAPKRTSISSRYRCAFGPTPLTPTKMQRTLKWAVNTEIWLQVRWMLTADIHVFLKC